MINIISQIEIKKSIFENLLNYIDLLMQGSLGGKLYLICCFLLIFSYFVFKNYKFYLKILLIVYIVLFVLYFISIHFYHEYIYDQFAIGAVNPDYIPEAFITNLDTSIFFIIFNFIFIIILFIQLKNKSKGK